MNMETQTATPAAEQLRARETASRLIANGYRVVPCDGKRVRISGWTQRDFTADDFAPGQNVGIKTGDGVALIDIDVIEPEAAAEITAEWCRRHEGLQRTGMAPKTAFLVATDVTSKRTEKLKDGKQGVEVLAQGQQFVAYGTHPDTGAPYTWHGLDPCDNFLGGKAALPRVSGEEIEDFLQWVRCHYGAPEKPLSEQARIKIDTGRAYHGDDQASPAEIEEALSYIDPDLPYDEWRGVLMALHDELGDQGLAIADRWSSQGAKYRNGDVAKKWRSFKPGGGVTIKQVFKLARDAGCDLSELSRRHRGSILSAAAAGLDGPPDPLPDHAYDQEAQEPPKKRKKPFALVRADRMEFLEPEFLVQGLVETDAMGVIFGDPGGGKSFFALDMAASIATGRDFHGRETRKGAVIYICGEGHNGIKRRLRAWEKQHDARLDDAPLYVSSAPAQFLDAESIQMVMQAIEEAAEEAAEPVAMIIIDTLNRNMGGGDENATADMSRFVAAVDDVRRAYDATTMIVHHTGHGNKERARGSMALLGAVDCEFRVEKSDAFLTITCTKMKEAERSAPFVLEMCEVVIGKTREGEEIKHAALRETDSGPAVKGPRLSASLKMAMDSFTEAKKRAGHAEALHQAVGLEEWRAVFYERSTADNEAAKRQAFHRARNELVARGLLSVTDDEYRFARAPDDA